MSSTSQQTLLTAFHQASGSAASGQSESAQQGLIDALGQATQVIDSQIQATSANTDALAQSSQSRNSSAGGAVSDVLSTASQILGGGLTLMPLVSLFSSLFGGGQSQEATPLTPYAMPPSLSLENARSDRSVVWGENGLPRVGGAGEGSAQQITVQVQAMDSQSFLDHSNDIAQAVRQAMLNMSSINDVISNL